MKRFLFLAGIVASLCFAPQASAQEKRDKTMDQQTSQVLLTVLTSADPQTQLMALILTDVALQKGAHSHILLCSSAGDLALKAPPVSATAPLAPKGMSPQGLLNRLIQSGAKVDVCAIYLPNRSLEKTVLLDGVGVATPSEFADLILLDGIKQLNF